jgi:hypothetical protein
MKTYKIPVSWTMITDMEIEADTIEEAFQKAEDMPLPTDAEYEDDSFEINAATALVTNELNAEDTAACEERFA